MKMFLEDDNAVHKLVASQYKIAPEKLMRTGNYSGAPRKYHLYMKTDLNLIFKVNGSLIVYFFFCSYSLSAKYEQTHAANTEDDFRRDVPAEQDAAGTAPGRGAPGSPGAAHAAAADAARLPAAPRRHAAAAAPRQQQQRA